MDATPKYNKFKMTLRTESQIPTIWLQQPQTIGPNAGTIRLHDGQKISLGEEGFQIIKMDDKAITISKSGGAPVEIPIGKVSTLRFSN